MLNDKKIYYLYYCSLTLLVMGSVSLSGYVLALDMVAANKLLNVNEYYSGYLLGKCVELINLILPSQLIQKLIIFLILFFSGIGAHRLINTKSVWPKYFAGIFYTINPFTYERWMAGQYLLLAGYALLPFLVASLINLSRLPNKINALKAGLWLSAIAMLSIHIFVMALILIAVMSTVYLSAKYKQKAKIFALSKYGLLATLVAAVLNSFWLIAAIKGTSSLSQTIDTIGNADIQAFATATNPHTGLFFNVLSMYGFWLEDDGRFAMPNSNLFLWIGLFLLIAALIIIGVKQLLKTRSLIAISIAISGLIGFIFALGVNAPITGPMVQWVLENVPFMKGFRDSQKFMALVVLAYVYFGAHGLNWLLHRIRKWPQVGQEAVRLSALALPVLYVPTMLFGFAGQLKPVDYPQSWHGFNKKLEEQSGKEKILFLPWHQYMSYDFTPRVIASPAPAFFYNADVVSSTTAELGGIKSSTQTPDSKYIDEQVLNDVRTETMGAELAKIDIEYVLLSEGFDHEKYGFLDKQSDLKLVSNEPGLKVYKNEAYKR